MVHKLLVEKLMDDELERGRGPDLYALPLTSHIPHLPPIDAIKAWHFNRKQTLIPKAANSTVGLPNWGCISPSPSCTECHEAEPCGGGSLPAGVRKPFINQRACLAHRGILLFSICIACMLGARRYESLDLRWNGTIGNVKWLRYVFL